ncbi:MAG: cytochrome c biogenesis protein CcsA [Candidatus Omnitrophica bacterium]|nr:cytochrome c biogenesis protein CcsA [Candidatus Omnitrophota bacterium]
MMKKLISAFACGLLAFAATSPVAADRDTPIPPQALQTIRHMAIQHNGRVKPFESFARETLSLITGEPQWGHDDPVQTVVSMMANPDHWQQIPMLTVPFIPLREPLGLARKTKRISYNDLVATRKLMGMLPAIVGKQRRDEKLTIAENETMDLFQRFVTLSDVLEQKISIVPPAVATEHVWVSVTELTGYASQQQEVLRGAWVSFLEAVRVGQSSVVDERATQLVQQLTAANPSAYPARWRLNLEVWYHHAQPFRIAWVAYLVAVIALLVNLGSARTSTTVLGAVALGTAFIVHAGGILCRVILGGRPPVSNFFETMLWLPFVAVVVSLILERIYRARYISLAAAMLAAITLILAEHVPLDSSISPVVAVLHSNLWLTIHVLTIVASYGALALATVLAHVYGWLYVTRRTPHPALPALGLFLYRVIQVGVVLLAGGIMLGAVWANASWGRYWGWDPKETWSLITLLWFLAILHGRFAGWIKGVGVALSTITGFFLLLMTYYGVSFYLVGLHSYAGGHAKPLPALLITYLVVEAAFIITVGAVAARRRTT